MKNRTVFGKTGTIIMILALSLSVLTGCGNSGDRNTDEVKEEGGTAADTSGMVHLDSADDVSAFMEEVYGGVAQDLLPPNIETTELDITDVDTVEYQTGLTNLNGIDAIYLSESMMSSTAYSAVYIRTTEDGDAELIRQQLMENINPAKWICVSAEKEYAVILGNDIFFVMGAQDTADEVLDKAVAAAKDRGMSTSDVSEITNPI